MIKTECCYGVDPGDTHSFVCWPDAPSTAEWPGPVTRSSPHSPCSPQSFWPVPPSSAWPSGPQCPLHSWCPPGCAASPPPAGSGSEG